MKHPRLGSYEIYLKGNIIVYAHIILNKFDGNKKETSYGSYVP